MVQSFVGFTLWELIVTICNTLITFLIIKKFLFKPVRAMVAAREAEVQSIYQKAEQDKNEAESLREQYTEKLKSAKEEAAEITKSATRRATSHSEEILKEANKNATEIMQKAERDIKQERTKVMNAIKDEISGISVMIASKVVEKDINEQDHSRLISDFIDKMEEA